METLLSSDALAARLQIAEITLRKWRMSGDGPKFVKVGKCVRYKESDVSAWLDKQTVASTSAYGA